MLASSSAQISEACRATIEDYAAVAENFAVGNMDHDVSQNIEALLGAPSLAGRSATLSSDS